MKVKITSLLLLCALFTLGQAQAEKIRIATEGAYPPFNMKNASGELTGFDIDIVEYISDY